MREHAKYYTPVAVATHCVDVLLDFLAQQGITPTEFLEPSAGGGAFLPALKASGIPFEAYDLVPDNPEVIEMNFFDYGGPLDPDYVHHRFDFRGRVCIGNPPFNEGNDVRMFVGHALQFCDYVAFILPRSYMSPRSSLKNAFLCYSEDLGSVDFGGTSVDVCFCIYSYKQGYSIKLPQLRGIKASTFTSCKDDLVRIHDGSLAVRITFVESGFLPELSVEQIGSLEKMVRFAVFEFDGCCDFVDDFKSFILSHSFKSLMHGKSRSGGLHLTLGCLLKEVADSHPEWVDV